MKYIILILLFTLITGCNAGKNDTLKESGRSLSELNDAPEKIIIDNKTYIIEPYVWRNLMPVTNPKDKTGLLMSIKLKTQDGTAIDQKIKASTAWVINNTDVWETPVAETELKEQTSIEYYARNGPEWKPEQKVNVVIEIEANNKKYLLQAKDQIIQAVY
ncbi:MAG: hypothetical protein EHM58_19455 [Ignavibacteriae bacterium]|nr:MAG: hypothetical protein EHM58_19455 [Ignavibacteriota bacterium]